MPFVTAFYDSEHQKKKGHALPAGSAAHQECTDLNN